MKSNLRQLLEEFLPEEQICIIETRAKELNIRIKVSTTRKGKWNRETLRKLIKERGDICSQCNRDSSQVKLTLDHIISRKILLDMGLAEFYKDESNLEILCSECNGNKGSQLDFNHPKTIDLFEKYLNILKERKINEGSES